MRLIDYRTSDGSRHFLRLPATAPWAALRDHVDKLPEVRVNHFSTDELAMFRLDFTFRRHRFVVNAQGGEYCFFVRDSRCSDVALFQLATYCAELLKRPPESESNG